MSIKIVPALVRKLFKSISNSSHEEYTTPIKQVIALLHRYNGVLFCTFYYNDYLTITSAIDLLANVCTKYEIHHYSDIELCSDYIKIDEGLYNSDGIKMAYLFDTSNIGQIMASFISMCGNVVHGDNIHQNYMHILNCNTNVGPTIILDDDFDPDTIKLYIDTINDTCI